MADGVVQPNWSVTMSRRYLLQVALALVCVAPCAAAAQLPAKVDKAMRARDRAEVTFDATVWDRFTADDFTIVLADGTLMTKAERLAQLRTQGASIDGQVVSEAIVIEHPFALPETPLRRHTDVQIQRHGNVFVRRFRQDDIWIVEIWAKDGLGWRVQAAQVTRARKK